MSRNARWVRDSKAGWTYGLFDFQLLTDTRLGAYDIAVYMALIKHADLATGGCFPAVKTLAGYVNANERTVRRALDRLHELEYISVDSKRGRISKYVLLPPPSLSTSADSGAQLDLSSADSDVPDPGLKYTSSADSGAEEQEPSTRTNNKRNYPGSKNGSQHDDSCEKCDDDWILDDEGNATRCPDA